MASAAAPDNDTDDNQQEKPHTPKKEFAGERTTNDSDYTEEMINIIDDRRMTEEITVPPIVMEDASVLNDIEKSPIRSKTEKITFPLTKEDKTDFAKLILRFEKMEELAGLSAPQIGVNKRAFVFQVKEDPTNKEEQTFEKSLWINPTYRNADGATLDEDYESCISIKHGSNTLAVGPVFRFNKIFYRAYDLEGRILEGEANGFAARVIQHEIDHLDGKLFADFVQPERLLSLKDYAGKMKEGTLDQLQTGIVPEFL